MLVYGSYVGLGQCWYCVKLNRLLDTTVNIIAAAHTFEGQGYFTPYYGQRRG